MPKPKNNTCISCHPNTSSLLCGIISQQNRAAAVMVSLPLDSINHFQISGGCGSRVGTSKAAELLQSQQNCLVEWKRETQSCNPVWERLRSCARTLLVSSREATKAKGDAQPDCSSFAHSQCCCKQLITHEQDTHPWHSPGQGRSHIHSTGGWLQAAPEVI